VAEVPPHLLDRSRSRRAALGLGSAGEGGSAEGAAAPAATPAAVVSAGPAAVTPSRAAAAPTPTAPAEPAPVVPAVPRGTTLAKMGSVFFLIATPVWALFMFNSFTVPKSTTQTPAQLGAELYSANCVSCHLSNGAGKEGGGVGRPLYNGSVEQTFPDPLAQVAFVKHGSCPVGTPYGDPKRAGGQHQAIGNMPAFDGVLTDEQILNVVAYERSALSGRDFPTDLYAKAGEQPDPARVLAPGAPATTIAPVSTEKVCG
jgi:mono/diheme cytochrome c family protein